MTPIDASTYWLSNDFNELTTNSEDQLTLNDCSVSYMGKQVAVVEQNNPCNAPEMVLTNSAILDPPDYYQAASKLESRVINPFDQTNPEAQVKELFCSTDEKPVCPGNIRSRLDMAYSNNNLSLAREVAALPKANAYLIELSADDHPPSIELVKFLLQAGVDPDAGESGEKTPLYLATRALSSKEVYTPFLVRKDYYQHHNKMKNWVGLAKELLAAGANPDPIDKEGYSPLTLLTERASPEGYPYCAELVEYLLNTAKADPNGNALGKQTPLYAAADCQDDPWCVQMLLTAGANVNAWGKGRDTPLYAAASLGYPGKGAKTVPLLLEAGADPNAFSTGRNTPLYGAIAGEEDYLSTRYREGPYEEGRFTVINKLLEYNADVNAKASGKETPLYAAATAYESDRGLVKLLLSYHADSNGDAKGKETPLLRVVEHILANKKKWKKYKNGYFELHQPGRALIHIPENEEMAKKAKETFDKSIDMAIGQVIKPLAEAGADPDANTQQEKETPRYIAEEIGSWKLSRCLNKISKEFKKRH